MLQEQHGEQSFRGAVGLDTKKASNRRLLKTSPQEKSIEGEEKRLEIGHSNSYFCDEN